MKNTETIETQEFTDSIIVTYLDYRKEFVIKPKRGGRLVSFIVSGPNLTAAIEEFYSNPKIPILNFIESYRKIRSMIFNLKGCNGKNLQ
jgi:hypothetical protein